MPELEAFHPDSPVILGGVEYSNDNDNCFELEYERTSEKVSTIYAPRESSGRPEWEDEDIYTHEVGSVFLVIDDDIRVELKEGHELWEQVVFFFDDILGDGVIL